MTVELCPSPRERDDLELMTLGALGSPAGFGPAGDAVTLVVPEGAAAVAAGDTVRLVDPEGAPLADLTVSSTYADDAGVGLVGEVAALQRNQYGAFRHLHLSPDEVRAAHPAETVTVPVRQPLTEEDLAAVEREAAGRPVLLLALSGQGAPTYAGRPLSGTGLLRATLAAAPLLPSAAVVAVPVAARSSAWGSEDDAFAARVVAAYAPGPVAQVTGEGSLPAAVADVIAWELPPRDEQGLVVFFTGLSGSGKSTLARALHDVVLERGTRTVTSLDGDVVRRNLSAGLTFSRADRETNIRRIGWVAAEISRHRGMAICSPIAPFDLTRKQVREMVTDAGGAFFLVHVATPVEECERRDRKGLYARARRGEIPDFTGISSPYETPEDADVRVDTTGRSIEDALADILDALDSAGLLPAKDA